MIRSLSYVGLLIYHLRICLHSVSIYENYDYNYCNCGLHGLVCVLP